MTAPSVTYSADPPHELKSIQGLNLQQNSDNFIGYVSLGALGLYREHSAPALCDGGMRTAVRLASASGRAPLPVAVTGRCRTGLQHALLGRSCGPHACA